MLVLLLGHRLGLARSLERIGIDYILWSTQKIKNELKARKIVVAAMPESREDIQKEIEGLGELTHVIAGVESTVIIASKARIWFNLKRNPHSLVQKCTNKFTMKDSLSKFQIPMTSYMAVNDVRVSQMGFPLVLKPKLSSGSRGIEFIKNVEDFESKSYDDSFYFEKMIQGSEGSVESFIVNHEIIFSNVTEYHKLGGCNRIPASYSKEILSQIHELNIAVTNALNIKCGMTHMEFYLTDNGVLFGEIALRPPGGYIMEALELAYGQNFWDIFAKVELQLPEIKILPRNKYAASIVIHPSEGVVESIHGIESVESLSSLHKLKLKINVGDHISKREGLGQDYGYALFENEEQAALLRDINSFYEIFKISMTANI